MGKNNKKVIINKHFPPQAREEANQRFLDYLRHKSVSNMKTHFELLVPQINQIALALKRLVPKTPVITDLISVEQGNLIDKIYAPPSCDSQLIHPYTLKNSQGETIVYISTIDSVEKLTKQYLIRSFLAFIHFFKATSTQNPIHDLLLAGTQMELKAAFTQIDNYLAIKEDELLQKIKENLDTLHSGLELFRFDEKRLRKLREKINKTVEKNTAFCMTLNDEYLQEISKNKNVILNALADKIDIHLDKNLLFKNSQNTILKHEDVYQMTITLPQSEFYVNDILENLEKLFSNARAIEIASKPSPCTTCVNTPVIYSSQINNTNQGEVNSSPKSIKRKDNPDNDPEPISLQPATEPAPEKITFNGTELNPRFKSIENSDTPLYIFYDQQTLKTQGMSNPAEFDFKACRLVPEHGQSGLKPLNMGLKIRCAVNGKEPQQFDITHELKALNTQERILCYSIPGDNHARARLLVAGIYVKKGLHNNSASQHLTTSFANKVFSVNLPDAQPQVVNKNKPK